MAEQSKQERFKLFLDMLGKVPVVSSYDDAFKQLVDTLNRVEDEFSGVPCNPDNWRTDGRMYPPQADKIVRIEGTTVTRLTSKGNLTYIDDNGAIQIWTRPKDGSTPHLLFSKPGANGKDVVLP